ncbi:hypothetical protein DSCW_63860 [Desulfosarcina widdelii]|uniref:Uncharacterized protein n=1 Tax=Desulfosarcina widdelii TaxID=947919 RepID=A0A5K7ZFN9_9BACT|nr:hypothetical protein DSCW_63860 [Desulfosarcina widdelii]
MEFKRIKADFNKLSLEMKQRFWYPFEESVRSAKRPILRMSARGCRAFPQTYWKTLRINY